MVGTSLLHGAADSFNSGGAGSVAYGVGGLKGDIYEQLLAETVKIILHDEMAYGDAPEARHPLYQLVKTADDARVALEIIREFSTVRLKGRNFQSSHPPIFCKRPTPAASTRMSGFRVTTERRSRSGQTPSLVNQPAHESRPWDRP